MYLIIIGKIVLFIGFKRGLIYKEYIKLKDLPYDVFHTLSIRVSLAGPKQYIIIK